MNDFYKYLYSVKYIRTERVELPSHAHEACVLAVKLRPFEMVLPIGFEPMSPGPKPRMLVHYTTAVY